MDENRKYLIGIDPSLENLGVCIYDPQKNIIQLKTDNFLNMMEWIKGKVNLNDCVAVVENPGLVSTVFKMWSLVKEIVLSLVKYELLKLSTTLKPGKVTIDDVHSKFSIAMNYAQKVGENKAAAKLLIAMLVQKKVPVLEVSPAKRDRADRAQQKANKAKIVISSLKYPTKTSAEQFKELTGYNGRSNEHNRDAATLVVGRSVKSVLAEINKIKPPSYPSGMNSNEMIVKRQAEQQIEMDFYSRVDDDEM